MTLFDLSSAVILSLPPTRTAVVTQVWGNIVRVDSSPIKLRIVTFSEKSELQIYTVTSNVGAYHTGMRYSLTVSLEGIGKWEAGGVCAPSNRKSSKITVRYPRKTPFMCCSSPVQVLTDDTNSLSQFTSAGTHQRKFLMRAMIYYTNYSASMLRPPVHPTATVCTSNDQVVCTETYHSLFDKRGEKHGSCEERVAGSDAENLAKSRGGSSPCRMDAFLVPRPSRYVPDWTAFASGGEAHSKNGQPDAMLSNQSSVASGENQKVKFGSYAMQRVRAVFALIDNKTPRLAIWGVTSGRY